jgi:hypothetical protein
VFVAPGGGRTTVSSRAGVRPEAGDGMDADGGLAAWAQAPGRRRATGHVRGGLRFVFYGRMSTEDWQDPVTSRARQREQAEVLVRGHGVIVAEFFDAGQSRTVAWGRRPGRGDPRRARLHPALARRAGPDPVRLGNLDDGEACQGGGNDRDGAMDQPPAVTPRANAKAA